MKQWNKQELEYRGALPITTQELIDLGFTSEQIDSGEIRGELKTIGPWQVPVSFKALCTSTVYTDKDKQRYGAEKESETAYGIRTLSNIHQSGYELEGRVSINGKKYSAFTSSQLFELEDKRLVNIATIHARVR